MEKRKKVTADTVFEIGSCPPAELTFAKEGKTVTLRQNGATIPMALVGPKRYTIQKAVYVTFGEKDRDGKRSVKLEQGGTTFSLAAAEPYKAPMPGQGLLAKVVEAQGGEAAIRRHPRSVVHYHGRLPSDAISEYGVRYRPGAVARVPDARHRPGDKVGDEPVWVREKSPWAGGKILDFVSQRSFRVLRRSSGTGTRVNTQEFSDFREVDGLILPFRTVTTHFVTGKAVEEVDSVRFDEYVPDWPWRIG